ncbi:MAG: signal recognition particle protein [Acidobacteria bacterium]|nr:MAG: signal recognition particle protein [Acidobacteriota bacterium]
MFESLSDKLQKVLRDLKGEGRVSEQHIEESMRQIRIALLEADVNFKVVKDFVARIKEKALGQEVMKSLTPGQQVVKIVRDELVDLLGTVAAPIEFAKVPPTVILMVGLQGSGKTTTTGKLALSLRKNGRRPLMVSTDVYRPAALEQLSIIGRAIDIPVFEPEGLNDALERARRGFLQARNTGYDVLLIDTAGRLHIDENLMVELERMQQTLSPKEILLVADAMTGQDAVNSAGQFDQRLALTGVILTKMDGDARGGAALSIKSVTGKPIKFIGVGEKYDALETFHPDRLAGRILGMGDVLSLIEKAEETVDEEDAEQMLEKLRRDQFTLEDFRDQLRQIKRLGPLEQILGMLPQIGPFKGLDKLKVDEKQLAHVEAIINSMTVRERTNYKIIDGSRRKRIAKGSGRPVSEVNRLLKQYMQARKMMKQVGKGFMGKRLPKLNFPI